MKPLYFAALEPPHVAPALSAQVSDSLRPFAAYLKSAQVAAQQREARSQCRWEPVPAEIHVRIEPLDTILALTTTGFAYRVIGWSGDPPEMPLFVGRDYRPVQPSRVAASDRGVTVWFDEPLPTGEAVYWAGRACQLEWSAPTWPGVFVRRDTGELARIVKRRDEAARLLLVVEGRGPFEVVSDTGEILRAGELRPDEGATQLRGTGAPLPWSGEREMVMSDQPACDVFIADNDVRWSPTGRGEGGQRRRRGVWVQLVLPSEEADSEATTDIRAAYCEDNVREVRVGKQRYAVFGARRDRYQLELEKLPPEGSSLVLPVNTSGLRRQREAIFRVRDSPLPHHRGLLRLCEHPEKVRWPAVREGGVQRWHLLVDPTRSGTLEQQAFVEKALGSPDFAFLEGPPGSGKTHAICELVLQLIGREQRVLLCSTTHFAVDNVLERLVGRFEQVEAVRVGRFDRVDPQVRQVQIDARIEALVQRWRDEGVFAELSDDAIERAAELTILGAVNLTCGTTTGILAHPYIGRDEQGGGAGPRWPYFDVLILDEASKTTFQEFLVPAQLARRWIIVGDVRQLPPFTEPKDLEASIAEVHDEGSRDRPGRVQLSEAYQRALLLLFRLRRPEAGTGRVRWLIERPEDELAVLGDELAARAARGEELPEIVRVSERRSVDGVLSVDDIEAGRPAALRLLTADWILVPPGLCGRVSRFLPPHVLPLRAFKAGSASDYRLTRWHDRFGAFARPIQDQRDLCRTAAELLAAQREFFAEQTWAKQVAWRIGRIHQLASARDEKQRDSRRRQAEVDALVPAASPHCDWVGRAIGELRDVGVRSVIETLRVPRMGHNVRRRSALTEAIPAEVWSKRSVHLSYQHRMHPEISELPRRQFYADSALRDANTLEGRDARVGWGFVPEAPYRRLWVDVRGEEARGINVAEIEAMRGWLFAWQEFALQHPRKEGKEWEVACLSFYNRQELATRDMLRRLTRQQRAETRFALANTTVSCATVDRFQGREADLVLLSLRNTRRPGHMDSPNRLNVGITRARFLLVIFGHYEYFHERCPSVELEALAKASPRLTLRAVK